MATRHYEPETFRSSNSIGYLLKMAHMQILDCATETFAPHDISFIQWLAMLKLREGQATTASELCRAMRHDNGALTRVLDQLEARGYLARTRSSKDRRVVELELTEAGNCKLDELMPKLVDELNLVLADFSKTELAEFKRLLNKLMLSLQANAIDAQGISS